ncbi:hypothetical protein D3C78_1382980 [compost metagenome]
MSRPQPSPVLPSALMPPRWVMQVSACMAVCRRWWLGSPVIWAIRPKPQLSLNSSGWYRPVFIDTFSPGSPLNRRQISFLTTTYHPRRSNASFFAVAMENHCCTATAMPTNFHVSPLKIYVAILNVFAPCAVIAAWLESEAFQP